LTAENGDDLYPETYDDYVLDSNGEPLSTRLGDRSEAGGVSGDTAFEKINTLNSQLTDIIKRGGSGVTSFSVKTRNSDFGNVFAFGGDKSHRFAFTVFYSSDECIITPLITIPYTLTASFNSSTQTLTITSTTIIYGGMTFIE
jgi:hypothetical protein